MKRYAIHRYPCIDRKPKSILARERKLKASFKVASVWRPDSIINIAFMDGTPKQKTWVEDIVSKELAPIVNRLTFEWNVPLEDSDIRVSFSLAGESWSYIGTECLDIPKTEMTMNLGWLDDDQSFDSVEYKNTGQVVIHEFCHALGMIHEHQNPKGNSIEWNKQVVYNALKRTNGWTPEQVDQNMFKKYGDRDMCKKVSAMNPYASQKLDIEGYCMGEEVNGSAYDPHSIMHYFYPATWILSGQKEIPVNTTLSAMDKKWLEKYYGGVGWGWSIVVVLILIGLMIGAIVWVTV